MTTRAAVFCHVCNEEIVPDEGLEHHLVYEHKPGELARELVAEWEADELGDAG